MNIKKALIPALSVAALVLSGCATKCDYATFHKKAQEAAQKEVKITKGTIKYSYVSNNSTTESEYHITWNAGSKYWTVDDADVITAALITGYLATTANDVPEKEEYTYFAGMGKFKVVSEDFVNEYQKNGFITLYKTDTTTFKVSYK